MSRPPRTGLGYQPTRVEFAGALGGLGSGAVVMLQLSAYARYRSDDRPYGVVNDYVSTRLGMAIGAPVPAGELVDLGTEWGFVSLGFGEHGETPPPANLKDLAEQRSWEATGILVLDQWVLNSDRHDDNVAYMSSLGVAAFDHDSALFGPNPGDDPLASLRQGLDMPVVGHPIARHLRTADDLEYWCRRVGSVGTAEVRRIAWACRDAGLISAEELRSLVDFIRHRQDNIRRYIEERRDDFTQIDAWPFSGAGGES